MIPLLTSVLRDESEWEQPYMFHPEHFLDDQGQFVKRDAFLAFSAGIHFHSCSHLLFVCYEHRVREARGVECWSAQWECSATLHYRPVFYLEITAQDG